MRTTQQGSWPQWYQLEPFLVPSGPRSPRCPISRCDPTPESRPRSAPVSNHSERPVARPAPAQTGMFGPVRWPRRAWGRVQDPGPRRADPSYSLPSTNKTISTITITPTIPIPPLRPMLPPESSPAPVRRAFVRIYTAETSGVIHLSTTDVCNAISAPSILAVIRSSRVGTAVAP